MKRDFVKKNMRAFTLIELLVVVGIIAVLMGILIPALMSAKERVKKVRCLANLSGIGKGLVIYSSQNDGLVVPSYNMGAAPYTTPFSTTNPNWNIGGYPLDGWAAILDRDGVVPGSAGLTNNIFYCPDTNDDAGMNDNPYDSINSPLGYQDWPIIFTGPGDSIRTSPTVGGVQDPTLPVTNFGDSSGQYVHEIRCSYWLNANNPTSATQGAISAPCIYYTQSVGYVGTNGTLAAVNSLSFVRPSALIVATDGVYSGRQSSSKKGIANCRIGYRHNGNGGANTVTNGVFADGHAESIDNALMPVGGTQTAATISGNSNSFSMYSNY